MSAVNAALITLTRALLHRAAVMRAALRRASTARAWTALSRARMSARRFGVAMIAAMAGGGSMGATFAFATPDLRQGRPAGTLTVYPDHVRPAVFYYPPGELAIAVTQSGAPDVHLLHARYTGSAASGDRGAKMVRSIFSLRLVMNGPSPVELAAARRELAASVGGTVVGPIELRPLPIRRMESSVVYAAAPAGPLTPSLSPQAGRGGGAGGDGGETVALPAGHAEDTDAPRPRDGYWTERIYTLRLDAADAQLLSEALERGGLALTVGYAFLADGIVSDSPSPRMRGEGWGEGYGSRHVVRAGAIGVTVDVKRWPRIIQRIDINDAAPAGYAALDVYCYDFNQGAESPLYEKQIEIDAAGIGGRRVQMKTTFSRAQPDLFARSLRFPVAVRLDAPYRFRVHEIAQDGSQKTSEWRERSSWTELLDVTTAAATARTTGEER